jgi:hypothetical protein
MELCNTDSTFVVGVLMGMLTMNVLTFLFGYPKLHITKEVHHFRHSSNSPTPHNSYDSAKSNNYDSSSDTDYLRGESISSSEDSSSDATFEEGAPFEAFTEKEVPENFYTGYVASYGRPSKTITDEEMFETILDGSC